MKLEIEPVVVQLLSDIYGGTFLKKGKRVWEPYCFLKQILQCASLTTKLAFQAMVDCGAMTQMNGGKRRTWHRLRAGISRSGDWIRRLLICWKICLEK